MLLQLSQKTENLYIESYLIKYLCYKIFKDGETKDILEASTISTLSIS